MRKSLKQSGLIPGGVLSTATSFLAQSKPSDKDQMKATLKASGAIQGSQTNAEEEYAQEQLVETDIAMEKEVEGDENIRTARRSQ